MQSPCPKCGADAVVGLDIEEMSDSSLLVKVQERIQLCCQDCGWLGFDDPCLDPSLESAKQEQLKAG